MWVKAGGGGHVMAIEPATLPNGTKTRYARVKQILDNAAGDSTAEYGGAGRFWGRSLEELKTICVHGVRMIAPEVRASCCGGDLGQSRSVRSGLIQGLRGTPPFDG